MAKSKKTIEERLSTLEEQFQPHETKCVITKIGNSYKLEIGRLQFPFTFDGTSIEEVLTLAEAAHKIHLDAVEEMNTYVPPADEVQPVNYLMSAMESAQKNMI